jgi:hypothetical protein
MTCSPVRGCRFGSRFNPTRSTAESKTGIDGRIVTALAWLRTLTTRSVSPIPTPNACPIRQRRSSPLHPVSTRQWPDDAGEQTDCIGTQAERAAVGVAGSVGRHAVDVHVGVVDVQRRPAAAEGLDRRALG